MNTICNTWTSAWSHTELPFRAPGYVLGQQASTILQNGEVRVPHKLCVMPIMQRKSPPSLAGSEQLSR